MPNRLKVRDFGTALKFNGVSDKAITSFSNVFNVSAFTISGWVKLSATPAAESGVIGLGRDGAGTYTYWMTITTGRRLQIALFDGSANPSSTSNGLITIGQWTHIAATFDGTVRKLYINGVADISQSTAFTIPSQATSGITIGAKPLAASNWLNGILDELRIWNTVLTAQEISDLYFNGIVRSNGLVGEWKFNEGAGSTANDTSGNANHGAITGATFTDDVVMKPRKLVNGNLLQNGDFEFAPPFVAATTTDGKFIDGTAAGSATNDLFRWGGVIAGSGEVQFDSAVKHSGNYSLRVSLKGVSAYIEYTPGKGYNSFSVVRKYAIPVVPGRQYVGTYWLKTNKISGDSNHGANLTFLGHTGDGALATDDGGALVKLTQDWTLYTVNITVASNVRYLVPRITLYGHTGAGNLIIDAWFDDIELREA